METLMSQQKLVQAPQFYIAYKIFWTTIYYITFFRSLKCSCIIFLTVTGYKRCISAFSMDGS